MRTRFLLVGIGLAALLLWARAALASPFRTSPSLEPASVALEGPALAESGTPSRARPTEDGIVPEASGGIYTTKPFEVAHFTDILVSWRADEPISATLDVYVRVSEDGDDWSQWALVHEDHDLIDERDAPDQRWGSPLFAGSATWWQVQVQFSPAPDGALPTLAALQVDTVDVGALPEPSLDAPRPDAPNGVAKPPVYSRTQWGSGDGQGSRVPPAYYPVSHLVVHHTVDPNTLTSSETWWGDRVRAIWSFHTFSRGWGDIGYNYLVAPNGAIFEGRAGGDNAVGFHDTGNYGSMGVAVIGTYSSTTPTAASQASLVELLAWKADQRNIDPLGSSYYYGCDISRYCANPGGVTRNIAGHRDVANNPQGYTTCPGQGLFDLLPTIRARVAARISSVADNGDMTIDNLESSFTRSSAQWYESACGDGGHVFYTFGTDNPAESTNTGIWRKEGLSADRYRIYIHVPQNCGVTNATQSARYTIWQNGVKIGEKVVSQVPDPAAEWIEITAGPTQFQASPIEVHLTDLTGEQLGQSRVVIFDTVRWVREETTTSVELEDVAYDRTALPGGELLKVTFRVRNTGTTVVSSQAPNPGSPAEPLSGYTYDEGECFLGNAAETYPAFPKESGRFRVMLGMDGFAGDCNGNTGGYPWRWGLGDDLQPGEVREIVGFVRFRNTSPSPRAATLRAGMIQEYVRYLAQDRAVTGVQVLPESNPPQSALFQGLAAEAEVFALGAIPDDFLSRTANPLSIPEGTRLGTLVWDGTRIDWGTDGPFGAVDNFIVRQTRTFVAPVAGTYRFRITSDDGAWLWIDGSLVAEAHGLHPEREIVATRWLSAGEHTLSFKYFERSSMAAMSYAWALPGWEINRFEPIPHTVGGGAPYANGYFGPGMALTIDGDDHGGSGVQSLRWSLNGAPWSEIAARRLTLTPGAGDFTLQYQSVDAAGNAEPARQVAWRVDGTTPMSQLYVGHIDPSGMIMLGIIRSDAQSGVAAIEISVRDLTTNGDWQVWQTLSHPAVGFFGQPGHTYAFRSRAVDRVGNQEAVHASPDVTVTTPANAAYQRTFLPMMRR